ncbi:hypothetical protein SEA_SHAGRAT_58 [Rhodococcus phage Shagrat]|nr:hypothetical protein SEA_SHAGRAT_58 [Rhodococcus phage Shagrat]
MVDTPDHPISWTREDVDRYLEAAGLDLPDWQRAWLIRAGSGGQMVATLNRRTGKRAAYEHTRNLAIALGYKVTDVPHGFTIEVPE